MESKADVYNKAIGSLNGFADNRNRLESEFKNLRNNRDAIRNQIFSEIRDRINNKAMKNMNESKSIKNFQQQDPSIRPTEKSNSISNIYQPNPSDYNSNPNLRTSDMIIPKSSDRPQISENKNISQLPQEEPLGEEFMLTQTIVEQETSGNDESEKEDYEAEINEKKTTPVQSSGLRQSNLNSPYSIKNPSNPPYSIRNPSIYSIRNPSIILQDESEPEKSNSNSKKYDQKGQKSQTRINPSIMLPGESEPEKSNSNSKKIDQKGPKSQIAISVKANDDS